MLEIYDKMIGEIPVLEIVQSDLRDKKLPLVVFYHGWTNVKERVLTNGYEIARRGIRVIIPEALYHGKRTDGLTLEAHTLDFWQIVKNSVEEFPQIINYYSELELVDQDNIGVSGLSMGGITTAAILAAYPDVKAGNILMGAPDFKEFGDYLATAGEQAGYQMRGEIEAELATIDAYDLGSHPEKIAGRPVHFWHGRQDGTVPFTNSFNFYEKYKEQAFGSHLSYTATEDDHRVPHDICLESADFFAKNLGN